MLTEMFTFVPPIVLGHRERLALQRRRWWLERRREVPCWLGSLLLHLLAVVVFGSLTVPITSDNTLGSLQLHATYTGEARWGGTTVPVDLADDEPQPALADPPPEIANLIDDSEGMPAHEEPDETEPLAAVEPTDDVRQELLAANDRPSPTAPSDSEPPGATIPPPQEMASDAAATPLGETKPPAEVGPQSTSATESSVALNAAAEGRADAESSIPSAANQQVAGGSDELAAMSDDTPRPADQEQQPYLAVVDRFIEADLGRLQRAEADRAKHDFDRLTPAAIPSLVYGLNRSAKIHASCPVAVLTFKLDMALRKNADPELLQYALDHLGDDVPDTAPHAKRLRALLEQWRKMDASGSIEPDHAQTTLKQRRSRTR